MSNQSRIVSILFADLAGYSAVKNDPLYEKLNNLWDDFDRKYLTEDNHFFNNTWGDAFLICSYDPIDLLEIALNLRDWYRNVNWTRLGFPGSLSVRIALHAEKARLVWKYNVVTDIVGHHVNATARIEPIVANNAIYCSDIYQKHTAEETKDFASFDPLGQRELAKGFGVMSLYEVRRVHEAPIVKQTPSDSEGWRPHGTHIPKIRKDFTEKELAEFQDAGFEIIKKTFQYSLEQLEKTDPDVSSRLDFPDSRKFTCEVFVRGKLEATCQVWSSRHAYSQGINYSTEINERNNTFNETLFPEHDGFEMYFRSMGMLMFEGDRNRKYNPEEAAQGLWIAFAKQLEF